MTGSVYGGDIQFSLTDHLMPLLPFQCLRLTAKILLRHLRCPEDPSVKNFGSPSAGTTGGPWEEGGPSQYPPPPLEPPFLIHPCWGAHKQNGGYPGVELLYTYDTFCELAVGSLGPFRAILLQTVALELNIALPVLDWIPTDVCFESCE